MAQEFDAARKRGFTLVELLVVIAIIGLLVALLLPAVNAAREAARRSSCQNNLKQIGIAVLNYESSFGHLPAGSTVENPTILGPYYSTWAIDILPFMEEQSLFDLWVQDQPLSSQANRILVQTPVGIYECPSDIELEQEHSPESGPGSSQVWANGSYRAISGHTLGRNGDEYWDNPNLARRPVSTAPLWSQGPMHVTIKNAPRPGFKSVGLMKIVDGLSKTFLVGEWQTRTHQSRRSFWAYGYTSYNQSSGFPESRTLMSDYDRCVQIGGGGQHTCKRAWGSMHAGDIIQYVSCDGSVKAISASIDMDIYTAACTIQSGIMVP